MGSNPTPSASGRAKSRSRRAPATVPRGAVDPQSDPHGIATERATAMDQRTESRHRESVTKRIRLRGAAGGFTFDHEGELVEATRSRLVARIGPRKGRLTMEPRWHGQEFPPTTGFESDKRPGGEGLIATFDYDEGVHPHRDIADGTATVSFHADLIEVVAYDDQAATPTDDDAPIAP